MVTEIVMTLLSATAGETAPAVAGTRRLAGAYR